MTGAPPRRAVHLTLLTEKSASLQYKAHRVDRKVRPGAKEDFMRRRTLALVIAMLALATPVFVSAQQEYADNEHEELAKAMKDAHVPLETGIAASAHDGTPISAKYEV